MRAVKCALKSINAHLTWPIFCLIHTYGRIPPHRCPQLQFLVRPLAGRLVDTFLSAKGRGELQRQNLCPRRATKGREEGQGQRQERQGQKVKGGKGNGRAFLSCAGKRVAAAIAVLSRQKKSQLVLQFCPCPSAVAVLRGPSQPPPLSLLASHFFANPHNNSPIVWGFTRKTFRIDR